MSAIAILLLAGCHQIYTYSVTANDGAAEDVDGDGAPGDTAVERSSPGDVVPAIDQLSDQGVDPSHTITGLVQLVENPLMLFTCESAPEQDCFGPIFVGAYRQALHQFSAANLVVGIKSTSAVDMTGGKIFSYTITGLQPGQTVYLSALLKETVAITDSPPFPEMNDIYSNQLTPPSVTVGQATENVTLTLNYRCPFATCGGP